MAQKLPERKYDVKPIFYFDNERPDQVNGLASLLRSFSTSVFNCLTACSDWSRMTFSNSFTAPKLSAYTQACE
jgi:hypothetical protein